MGKGQEGMINTSIFGWGHESEVVNSCYQRFLLRLPFLLRIFTAALKFITDQEKLNPKEKPLGLRYTCPQLANIDIIDIWYRYRAHPYKRLGMVISYNYSGFCFVLQCKYLLWTLSLHAIVESMLYYVAVPFRPVSNVEFCMHRM